jgi:hypothetical protein
MTAISVSAAALSNHPATLPDHDLALVLHLDNAKPARFRPAVLARSFLPTLPTSLPELCFVVRPQQKVSDNYFYFRNS